MMQGQIDFYAPYQMPDGRMIYGAAAANRRVADAGGHNKLSYQLVMTGVTIGYNKAIQDMRRQSRR
ncbi:hypothetical protein ACE1B4_21535 [Aeromonas veronii]|uniref:hypothetical protein n=1 Tax=Aeromonas veronii TaxID=654 RepID=UPI0011161833|nr:hypothetical protein [Aeromonas veronii]HDO1313988.1 hypothetical protein [Aeromonas veronii]